MQLRNVSGMNIPRGHRLAALACRVPSPRTSERTVRLLNSLTNDNIDNQPRHHYFHRLYHCALLRRRCVIVIFRSVSWEHSLTTHSFFTQFIWWTQTQLHWKYSLRNLAINKGARDCVCWWPPRVSYVLFSLLATLKKGWLSVRTLEVNAVE